MRIHSTAVVPSDSDAGATAVEYALMVGFVVAVVADTVVILGQEVVGLFLTVFPAF